jgi:hypothetical protein
MSNCHVSNQIAKHCDEPEAVECTECHSSMTETNSATSTWTQCDECEYQTSKAKDLTEAEQYEADAKADHLTEQIPNV